MTSNKLIFSNVKNLPVNFLITDRSHIHYINLLIALFHKEILPVK